ncbi:GbsR/MarR family transcriptional regulator [Paenibacillus sp. FSL W7-1287]|uniref:GbsR/MarR family transcriptional regulator n=1 Tax=Paenibacillus sp. FSL W7-1287 TaxID=2954538 RepID=UPI0030F6FEED
MNDQPFELDKDKSSFIDKLGMYYEDYGIPRIGGRILGLMLVSEQPLSAEQMSKHLKISRGSVSTNVRLLTSSGLLERTTVAGERTDYYLVSESIWERAIQIRIEGFTNLKRIVEQGIQAVESKPSANNQLYEMRQWVDVMINSHEQTLMNWKKETND